MSLPLKKLAIYYGWPSTVNATYTVAGAANVFKDYDMVIFGDGLESSNHADHQNTVDIINHADMVNTDVYGFVNGTDSLSTIKKSIDKWSTMGIVGMFCDRFGYDFGLTRQKQNNIVDYIHSVGLKAFVNSWDPDDTFYGTPSHKLNTDDWFLAESYAVINGIYETETNWKTRSDKLATYSSDVQIAAVTTTDSNGTFSQQHLDYAYACSALYKLKAFGWGEKNYSAAGGTNSLPLRSRPTFLGTKVIGNMSINNGVYEISTNVGINVDTNEHSSNTILN